MFDEVLNIEEMNEAIKWFYNLLKQIFYQRNLEIF
jgi:hypothetical protein